MKQPLLTTLVLAGLAYQARAQAVTFSSAVAYGSGGTGTSSVAVQDLNGDGKLDIVLANTSSTVGVLLNTGTGTFPATATTYASGATAGNASAVALGDVNADGKTDIVVLNTNDSTVGVLLGTGTGTFTASPAAYATGGTQVQQVKVGAVNNDGKLDVVTANYFDDTVSVLLGTGTGSLGIGTTYNAGNNSTPGSVALGDLNKDGQLDMVSANYALNSAGVLLGQRAGGFPATATQFSTGSNSAPNEVVVADVNADGKPDLITANFTTAKVAVLLNTSVLATKSALLAAGVVVYPNPAHGTCGVQVPGVAGATTVLAELRTALGQRVHQQAAPLPSTGTTLTLPTAGLAAGVYLLQLQAGDHTLVQRVVVQ